MCSEFVNFYIVLKIWIVLCFLSMLFVEYVMFVMEDALMIGEIWVFTMFYVLYGRVNFRA